MGLFMMDHAKVDLLERKKDVPKLIKALKNLDWHIRVAALNALGRLKDPRAVEPIIHVCGFDQYWDVRWVAAEVLGDLGDRRAVGVLIESLDYQNVTPYAARALGRLGDPGAVEPLLDFLVNKCPPSAEEAVCEALGLLGDSRAVDWIKTRLNTPDKNIRLAAAKALYKLGLPEDAMDRAKCLIELEVWDELIPLGQPAAEILYNLLSEADENQAAIVSTLEKMGEGDDPRVRVWRLYLDGDWAALGEFHDERAFMFLSRAFHEQKGDALTGVIQTLSRFGGSKAAELVVNFLLEGKDGGVKEAALSALRAMGKAAADALCEAAQKKAVMVKALSLMDDLGQGNDPRVRAWRLAAEKDAWKQLPALGAVALEPIISIMYDYKGDERRALIAALGDIGGLRAANYLVSMLGDGYPAVAKALEKMHSEEVETLLLEKLHDETRESIRLILLITLGNMGCDAVATQIIEQIKAHYAHIRGAYVLISVNAAGGAYPSDSQYKDISDLCALIGALGQIKTANSRPVLAPLVREGLTLAAEAFHKIPRHYADKNFYGAESVLCSFSREIALSATAAMEKLDLSDSPEERMWALAALGKWDELSGYGPAAAEMVCAAMCTTATQERRKAIATLGIIGGQQAVNALIRETDLYYDPKYGDRALAPVPEAIDALGRIGDGSCVDTLIRMLTSYHNRGPAARALVALYHSGRLDEAARLKVLNERETMIEPHVDTIQVRSYKCSDFNNSKHTDRGVGAEFPL